MLASGDPALRQSILLSEQDVHHVPVILLLQNLTLVVRLLLDGVALYGKTSFFIILQDSLDFIGPLTLFHLLLFKTMHGFSQPLVFL